MGVEFSPLFMNSGPSFAMKIATSELSFKLETSIVVLNSDLPITDASEYWVLLLELKPTIHPY